MQGLKFGDHKSVHNAVHDRHILHNHSQSNARNYRMLLHRVGSYLLGGWQKTFLTVEAIV